MKGREYLPFFMHYKQNIKWALLMTLGFSGFNNLLAQQNYFNVPSGDITREGKYFFQYQSNFTQKQIQNNITLDRGWKHGLETGINIFNADYDVGAAKQNRTASAGFKILTPALLLNVQKAFDFKVFNLMLGAQGGMVLHCKTVKYPAIWQYSLIQKNWKGIPLETTAGIAFGNKLYQGDGKMVNILAGADIQILKKYTDKLHLSADAIYGNSVISVFSFGFTVQTAKHSILSFARQMPFRGSTAANGWIFEWTIK